MWPCVLTDTKAALSSHPEAKGKWVYYLYNDCNGYKCIQSINIHMFLQSTGEELKLYTMSNHQQGGHNTATKYHTGERAGALTGTGAGQW